MKKRFFAAVPGVENLTGFGSILLLIFGLTLAVSLIVIPLVFLAVQHPQLFRLLTLGITAGAAVWLLQKKYRNMELQHRSDTRSGSISSPLKLRFLLSVLLKPAFWCAALVLMLIALYTIQFQPVAGFVALVVIGFGIMVTYKKLLMLSGTLD